MGRELYKRIAPHFQRIAYDAVNPTTRASELIGGDVGAAIALQNYLDGQKNDIRILYCPHLYGNRIRQSGNLSFVTKGYSANSPLKPSVERRNLLTWTEEFDNAAWDKHSSIVTPNNIENLNGVFSADKIAKIDSTFWRYVRQSVILSAGTYTLSSYMKLGDGQRPGLTVFKIGEIDASIQSDGNNVYIGFNMNNNSFTNSLKPLNDGWFRLSTTFTITGGTYNIGITVDGSSTIKYNYFWGAQLELGSSASEYQRVLDANSWEGSLMDLTQTTAANQPYLCGNIAPNEKLGIKNPNGGQDFLTHPTISYEANEAWSVTTVLNWNGTMGSGTRQAYCGSSLATNININYDTTGYFRFASAVGIPILDFTNVKLFNLIGKSSIITLAANGTGSLSLYIKGALSETKTDINTTCVLNQIFIGFDLSITRFFNGNINFHKIQNNALTPQQVATEHSLLRSLFPEIESVQIGSQTWATSNCEMAATPMGSVIQEMQANGNVERITNAADREFSSDTGWWSKTGETTIANGVCNIKTTSGSGSGIVRTGVIVAAKWQKFTYTITRNNGGSLKLATPNISLVSTVGTHTIYFLSNSTGFDITRNAGEFTDIDIDNISIQEIGWAGSQELYDGIYAQTAGTVEQKTLAACKAAAMWCHYNNSIDNGATYGKLFNWFAVKLLQMDIDAYNAANPATPWGWRVPTRADFETLSTTLGGNSVAGGKVRKEGSAYWQAPNSGATNESGFSAIANGQRNADGAFANINGLANITSITETFGNLDAVNFELTSNTTAIYAIVGRPKGRGHSLRLIKT